MRIISKFRDFYDSALAHGADMGLVYARETVERQGALDALGETLDLRTAPRDDSHDGTRRWGGWDTGMQDAVMPCVLLFCGKAYPFFHRGRLRGPGEGLWNAEGVHTMAAEVLRDDFLNRYMNAKRSYSDYMGRRPFVRSQVEGFLAGVVDEVRAGEIHHAHNCPVILYRAGTRYGEGMVVGHGDTILNPCLRELGFFKVKDPFAAFQEISMYLGGVLRAGENPMVAISDKDKVAKHGMDEWSFRRPPQAKGAR